MTGWLAYELIFALAAMAAITAAFRVFFPEGAPAPSSFWGHTLGIVGFLLMLSTETLYSLRKRLPGFHRGRMSLWLQAHVFTGLVGAYLVVLHSAGKFQGLAGLLTLVTVVVVLSGILGRYIYTAVPRTLEGVEVAFTELQERLAAADRQIARQGRWPARALAGAGGVAGHRPRLVAGAGPARASVPRAAPLAAPGARIE